MASLAQLIVITTVLLLADGDPITPTLAPRPTIDLIDSIKQKLRKNNDDYLIATEAHATSNSNITSQPAKEKNVTNSSVNSIYLTENRRFDQAIATDPATGTPNRLPMNMLNVIDLPIKQRAYIPAQKTNNAKQRNFENGKIRLILEKKKQMFKNLNKNQGERLQQTVATKPTMRALKEVKLTSQRAQLDIPDETRLDMAPARGGRIHSMRLKGRLCQRSVLWPEGPKYDRAGAVYLGAFRHAGGLDFAQTRPPRLVLPRCCNCCKKSVLGCE